MSNGDHIKIKHPKHGVMDALVIRVNEKTVEVMTLDGPVIVGKNDVVKGGE